MAVGDYLSSKAEFDFLVSERRREEWEYDNYPEGEAAEMVDILAKKGFAEEDARGIIGTVSKREHKEFFLDYMMIEELGQEAPDDPKGPLKDGIATGISFFLFGSLPMWVYVAAWGMHLDPRNSHDQYAAFGMCCAATAMTLFLLGALQGAISRQSLAFRGTLMMINGSLAAAGAFLLSWGITAALGGNGTDCSI
jgi:VIT1/CCC1 family predicted Fe2+/Mn2+ transporter